MTEKEACESLHKLDRLHETRRTSTEVMDQNIHGDTSSNLVYRTAILISIKLEELHSLGKSAKTTSQRTLSGDLDATPFGNARSSPS